MRRSEREKRFFKTGIRCPKCSGLVAVWVDWEKGTVDIDFGINENPIGPHDREMIEDDWPHAISMPEGVRSAYNYR